jgi:hypothetical protein
MGYVTGALHARRRTEARYGYTCYNNKGCHTTTTDVEVQHSMTKNIFQQGLAEGQRVRLRQGHNVRLELYIGAVLWNSGWEQGRGTGSHSISNNGCPAPVYWRCTTNNNKLKVHQGPCWTHSLERHVISNT